MTTPPARPEDTDRSKQDDARKDRLAEALRQNLLRRKAARPPARPE